MGKFPVKIITPSEIMFDGEAEMVIMRAVTGDMAVLAGHQPIVTVLGKGALRLRLSENEEKKANVNGGFAQVDKNGMSVFTDGAAWSKG